MAVVLRGMSPARTVDLTMAMVRSGQMLDLRAVAPIVVDKHSTGGVGDKTTLTVLPMVAAVGLPVLKMSGRGLGYSGGTLDKLESIPGFRVSLSLEQLFALVEQHGIALAGQTADLAPADGKLYALRDVTATVPRQPLIAISVMSKKIAAAPMPSCSIQSGTGAFMPPSKTRALWRRRDPQRRGRGSPRHGGLTDMNQPLGSSLGNALERTRPLHALGGGPADFREHACCGRRDLALGGLAASAKRSGALLEGVIA
jgi:pyrimidine-nucleoside phosphorylase